ncbi:hypothetical protein DL98DRAFT_656419 [Cadophora sp. DSE1049]|nr:hypothetical protein DL98DRAFT_656419 [Cadophora sp. DSE1049]
MAPKNDETGDSGKDDKSSKKGREKSSADTSEDVQGLEDDRLATFRSCIPSMVESFMAHFGFGELANAGQIEGDALNELACTFATLVERYYQKRSPTSPSAELTNESSNEDDSGYEEKYRMAMRRGDFGSAHTTVTEQDLRLVRNGYDKMPRLNPYRQDERIQDSQARVIDENLDLNEWQTSTSLATLRRFVPDAEKKRKSSKKCKKATSESTEEGKMSKSGKTAEKPDNAASSIASASSQHQALLDSTFPNGFIKLETSGHNLMCGLHALQLSILAQFPNLPVITLEDLHTMATNNPRVYVALWTDPRDDNLPDMNNFHADQLMIIAQEYAAQHNIILRLGILHAGNPTQLFTVNDDRAVTLMIHHNGFGHFEGIASRPVEENNGGDDAGEILSGEDIEGGADTGEGSNAVIDSTGAGQKRKRGEK